MANGHPVSESRVVYGVLIVIWLIAFALLVAGLVTPAWLVLDYSELFFGFLDYKISMGLWYVTYCASGGGESKELKDFWDNVDKRIGGFVVCCLGAGHFIYQDCNISGNKIIHFENAVLSADPMHFPGNETLEIDVLILKPISGMHFKLRFHLQKKVFLGYIDFPCISNFGTCDYQLCELLSGRSYNNTNHCPKEIASSTPNFPCACPFQPGTYHLNPTTFLIKTLSGWWQFYEQGDFRLKATIVDTDSNEEVGAT